MFEIGDFVVYGTNGVCQVESIGPFAAASDDRLYYTLAPVYVKGGKVYTPIDNTKVVLRKVITPEEAQELIDEIPDIETLEIVNDRERETVFKEMLKNCDCRELVRMLRNIFDRKQERLRMGKKTTVSDDRFYKLAEDELYGELSVSLGVTKEEIKSKILSCFMEEEIIPV